MPFSLPAIFNEVRSAEKSLGGFNLEFVPGPNSVQQSCGQSDRRPRQRI